jgi:hypothetical protein
MYITILNFETAQIDCLEICNKPKEMDCEEFTESILDYSLSNCEWLITDEKPHINFLNL